MYATIAIAPAAVQNTRRGSAALSPPALDSREACNLGTSEPARAGDGEFDRPSYSMIREQKHPIAARSHLPRLNLLIISP